MNKTSVGEGRPSSKKPACKSGNYLNVEIWGAKKYIGESKEGRRNVKKPAHSPPLVAFQNKHFVSIFKHFWGQIH